MNIVVVEDHRLTRDMLALSCRTALPAARVHLAETGKDGLDRCGKMQPALVFLGSVLPDRYGLDILPEIIAVSPKSKVIAVTSSADEFSVHCALRFNVHGFIATNEQPIDMLRTAIERVVAGGRYFSPSVQRLRESLRADPVSFDKVLSNHEQQLLSLFGEGLSNRTVAERLGLSMNTVKVHRRNILGKLGIHSTPQLIHYAFEKGFTRVRRQQQ
jgi:DNA-binding NarL/FixJ family response regulator